MNDELMNKETLPHCHKQGLVVRIRAVAVPGSGLRTGELRAFANGRFGALFRAG